MECYNCGADLEFKLDTPRWDVDSVCPKCKKELTVSFDFVLMDDGDEWDLFTIVPRESNQILQNEIYELKEDSNDL